MPTHDTGWLAHHRGETVVVKFGGNAMVDDSLKRAFAQDIVLMLRAGIRPVVVHGGGPQISAELQRRGIASEFRGGLRVTTPETLEVVRDVLTGQISRELAELISEQGGAAVALSGEQASLFTGKRRGTIVDGQRVDLGLVGDVVAVDCSAVLELMDEGRVPVVSSISPDGDVPGQSLNVNADSAAASLAIALGAHRLIILTDVPGLYRDWPNRDSVVSTIDPQELAALLPQLESGMIPKMTACLEAVTGGVPVATIIDGRVAHSLVNAPFQTTGTSVLPHNTVAGTTDVPANGKATP